MIGAGASPRQLEKRRADFEAEMLILGAASIPRQCSPLCMVTTFMPRGTAVQHLGKLSWNPLTIVKLLFEVALGMNHLHSRPTPILHSDLKGANVLVDENGTARVADFGLTKIRQGATAGTFFFGGTPAYIAPEVRRHTRSRASDVYSFGMMTWELFSMGEMPFEDDLLEIPAQAVAQMFGERIKSEPDYRPTRPDGCPDGAWDVMTQCWAFDQAARPAFGAVADGLKGVQMGTP
ncbi:kinase-like domain-containing protein [Hyaloraphidium curvatum]|nr:kinase-like domain-containing protein [Hyaloraphidium curvatum]